MITDLGVLRKGSDPSRQADGRHGRPASGSDPFPELTLTALHPGVTLEQAQEATAWELKVADDLETTDAPTEDELALLRELKSA